MTAPEWAQLADLIAIVQQSANDVCEFIDVHMKREIEDRLRRAGVPNYVEDACQDVLVNVRRNICQLEEVDLFEAWLGRVAMSSARAYRPRYIPQPKPVQHHKEKPKECGTKAITVDGKSHLVRVFAPAVLQERPNQKRPVFEPVRVSILAKASMAERPDYPCKIDVQQALQKLPKRWAKALSLIYVEELSTEEAAEILGCRVQRIYRLVQLAKARMRELMPGYGQSEAAQSSVCTGKVTDMCLTAPLPVNTPTHTLSPSTRMSASLA